MRTAVPRTNRLQQTWQGVTRATARRLRDAFIAQAASNRRGARFWAAQVLGFVILLAYAVLIAWSAWAVWRGLHPFHAGYLILGALGLMLAWTAKPELTRLPRERVTPADAPELHQLVQDISAAINGPRRVHITLSGDFNASMTNVTLGRDAWMTLGLPIMLGFEPQERVFVIAHELAHAVNADPKRGFWYHSALRFLWTLARTLRPTELYNPDMGIVGVLAVPFNLLMLGASTAVLGLMWLLMQLSGEASQRAEYHADLLAARVSGTPAALSALAHLHLTSLYDYAMHKHHMHRERPDVFAELRHQLRAYPREGLLAASRAREEELTSLDDSHPPTSYREAVIAAHPFEPAVLLTPERAARIERELQRFVPAIERDAIHEYRERMLL